MPKEFALSTKSFEKFHFIQIPKKKTERELRSCNDTLLNYISSLKRNVICTGGLEGILWFTLDLEFTFFASREVGERKAQSRGGSRERVQGVCTPP